MPRVTLIIVNYNGQGLIRDCLKGLERQSFKDFKVVVVDNGSLLDIRRFLEESPIGSLVKLVPLERNLGFAGGNVEGLKHADGNYIALLNNDAAPDKNWLGELVMAMDSDPEVGICASRLIVHGSEIIDSAGDGFSTSLKGFKRGEGEAASLFNRVEYVFGACAGAPLERRKMIEKIGFLDEDFF
jgi:GT2 family glycosyltransferase